MHRDLDCALAFEEGLSYFDPVLVDPIHKLVLASIVHGGSPCPVRTADDAHSHAIARNHRRRENTGIIDRGERPLDPRGTPLAGLPPLDLKPVLRSRVVLLRAGRTSSGAPRLNPSLLELGVHCITCGCVMFEIIVGGCK